MGKNKIPDWREVYNKIVRNARLDDSKTERLLKMLDSSKKRYDQLKPVRPNEADDYYKSVIIDLRKAISKFEIYKPKTKTSTSKTKENMQQLKELTLFEKVTLMELTENKGHFIYKEEPYDGYTRSWMMIFLKSLQHLTPEEANKRCTAIIKRILLKIDQQKLAIKNIQDKTQKALDHIDELDFTIKYLTEKKCTDFQIKPYLKRFYWLIPERPSKIKATIIKDKNRCNPKKKRKYIVKHKFDVRKSYLLNNVPEFKPQMYMHLENPRALNIRVK